MLAYNASQPAAGDIEAEVPDQVCDYHEVPETDMQWLKEKLDMDLKTVYLPRKYQKSDSR
jgi:hypothetical protein